MGWNTLKLSETAYAIEDPDAVPGGRLVIGSIVHPPGSGRWYVEIMRMDGDDVKGDFAKYETALAFIEGIEKMQKLREQTAGR